MADTDLAAEPQEDTADNPPATPDGGDQPDDNDTASSEIDTATEKHLSDLRKENANWRTKLRKAEKKIEDLTASSASDIEKAKAEARQEALAEGMAEANKRIIRAEIIAAAAGKLQDPADALGHIDLDGFELDDNGELDRKALAAQIDSLLKTKPYLGRTRDPDFGHRQPSTASSNPDAAMDAWLRAEARR